MKGGFQELVTVKIQSFGAGRLGYQYPSKRVLSKGEISGGSWLLRWKSVELEFVAEALPISMGVRAFR